MEQCFKKENFIYLGVSALVMDKKKILETLFDQKIIKILKMFINHPDEQYYLREIAKITKVPPASTYRILKTMMGLELLNEAKFKHLKTYSLNKENSGMFAELLEDKRSAMVEFTDFIPSVEGIDMVILHGKEEADKASVLIVGRSVNQDNIREKTVEIKEKYKFNIIYLILSPEQYEQMLSMGLYPGKKVMLFSKV